MPHGTTQVVADLARALRRNAAALAVAVPRARRGEVRAIHRLRVATRRLRAAIPVAAGAVGEDADRMVRDLRRVTKGLGPVRELDVSRAVLTSFAAREDWPVLVVTRVAAYCERLREEEFAHSVDVLGDLDARAIRRRLNELADRLEKSANAGRVSTPLAERIRECSRTLTRDISEAGTVYAPLPLHRVRISAKKLRYVLELAGELRPDALRRLKKAQALLGHLHDAQVLQHRILELSATTGDRGVAAILSSMDQSIEAACRAWHAEILKKLPGVSEIATATARAMPQAIGPKQIARPIRMASREGRAARRRARIA